jgi:Uncharacterized archaeal kinase related to aspartokinases, uridylate kinases
MVPLVMKLGGSLQQRVPELVRVIRAFPHAPILVIPGGGVFADQVRSLDAPKDASHWMAIAAMDQFGWYIASQGLEVAESLSMVPSPHVFLPYRVLRDQDPLPHTWDITSDTIAAWVALVTHADLVILKSVDGLYRDGIFQERVQEVFPCLEVDPAFLPYVLDHRIHCTVLNGNIPERLRIFLEENPVLCTRVETTF